MDKQPKQQQMRTLAQQIGRALDQQLIMGISTEPSSSDWSESSGDDQSGRDILADLEQAQFLLSRPMPVAI